VADAIRSLEISSRPFMSVYYPERALVLPSGTVIEEDVKPLEGYAGEHRKVRHRISYPGGDSV